MRNDFWAAVAQLTAEKGLPKGEIVVMLEAALVSAYKRDFSSNENIVVRIEPATGAPHVFALRRVVEDVTDPKLEIGVTEARRITPDAQLDDELEFEVTPPHFGRIGAQTAKQVMLQKLREAERDHVYAEYIDRESDLVSGIVRRMESRGVILDLGRAEALLPPSEQVPTERYRMNQRLRVYLMEVDRERKGPMLIVSRAHRNFLRRLLELEIPEIYNGTVEVRAIAREAGSRSKVAVHARQPGLDPVGSCVGQRGMRIQTIVNELSGERIDVIQWAEDPAQFVSNALSPAKVVRVETDEVEKTAHVMVPESQLSLAIGKDGQNARLGAKLTGWRVDIRSETASREAPPAAAAEPEDLPEAAAAPEAAPAPAAPERPTVEAAPVSAAGGA